MAKGHFKYDWSGIDWSQSNQDIASQLKCPYDTVAHKRKDIGMSHTGKRATRKDVEQQRQRMKSQVMREKAKINQPIATQAALKSPKAKKGVDNVHAKEWCIISPDGVTYRFINLYEFIRNNGDLFHPKDVTWKRKGGKRGTGGEYCNASAGFLNIKGLKAKSWKGWKLHHDLSGKPISQHATLSTALK